MSGADRSEQDRPPEPQVDVDAPPAPEPPAPEPPDDADAPAPEPPDDTDAPAPEPPDDTDAPARPAEDLTAALAEAERVRDEYLDHLQRERAAFDNFRRRVTKERMDALDRGAEALVASLLGVLDTFGFALEAAEDRDEGDQLAKGVQLLHTELMGVLRRAGLEEVPGAGAPFNPVHHEAMLQVEAQEPTDEPVVVEVLRPGYRFKGRVLRPASVKVAK